MLAAGAKAAVLLFFAVVVQVTIVGTIGVLGGSPDLVLVILVAIALLNGAVFGAVMRLLGRPAARRLAPRHARVHVALADPGGVLGRPVRRDDGEGARARAAGLDRGRDRPLRDRLAHPPLHARRPGVGEGRARRCAAPRGRAEPDPGVPGLRPVPQALRARCAAPGGGVRWLAPAPASAPAGSCRRTLAPRLRIA